MLKSSPKNYRPFTDEDFDNSFSTEIKQQAFTHFTPVEIAATAAHFLAPDPGTRVLDIGSGVGKFCLVGAAATAGHFTGIELRQNLSALAMHLKKHYRLDNLDFIQGNVLDIDLTDYQSFYLFNPFYENLLPAHRMDDALTLNRQLYKEYTAYVRESLEQTPPGTRLVTYYSSFDEVPDSFQKLPADIFPKLERWVKG